MGSLCVFAVHTDAPAVDATVIVLARELARHFDRVLVSTTREATAEQVRAAVPGALTHVSANDSYDIGLFYKAWTGALTPRERAEVTRLGFVNDSNILLSRLDAVFAWARAAGADVWGLTDNAQFQYHVQSPFLVFERAAIAHLESFFKRTGVADRWRLIADRAALRQTVIDEFELRLTAHMLMRGARVAVYTPCVRAGYRFDATALAPYALVALGHPMVKRKWADARDRVPPAGELKGEAEARALAQLRLQS